MRLSHRLIYLNSWFSVGGLLGGTRKCGLGGVVVPLEVDFEFKKSRILSVPAPPPYCL